MSDIVDRIASKFTSGNSIAVDSARITADEWSALLAHIQRGAVPEGWQLVPKDPTDAMRAAVIREQRMLMQASNGLQGDGPACDQYRAMLAAAPAPDHFRDAAEMVAEPAEVKLYAWRPSGNGEYSFYVASTSEEAARIAVQAEVDGMRIMGGGYETNGWGTDYYTLECVGLNEVMTNDND